MKARRRRSASRWPFDASARGLAQLAQLAGRQLGVEFVTELRFHPPRRWQFDAACEQLRIALEYEGGIYSHQGHTRPVRFRQDLEKYNQAQIDGWLLLRFGPDETRTGEALFVIEQAIKSRGNNDRRTL